MKTITIIINAAAFFMAMTILTGFVYPLFVTGVAQGAFPFQANGSVIKVGDTARGSRLLSQEFTSDRFFQARPSAASYATVASGASNLSPVGKKLADAVEARAEAYKKLYGSAEIPADLLYASSSGLDPDISLESALLQVERVSRGRGFTEGQKEALVEYIKTNPLSRELFPSPARINIMDLNAALETDPRFYAPAKDPDEIRND